FQDYALFPHLSAWRNVAFGLVEVPRAERRERATRMLERFKIAHLAEERPRELSGGERQRVALARALAREPALLLLDEPLAALDSRTRAEAGRELGIALADAGVPAVLVTHDFADAALLADQVAVIDRGRIVQRGTAGELSARPASAFVADFAGAAVLFGVARAGAAGTTLVALDGGGELVSTDVAQGPVAAAIYPWEIALEPADAGGEGSALNRLRGRVESLREIGNRVRVGLAVPQPLAAEVTSASVSRLGLEPGAEVVATWKATATRLTAR
ncbi:MAG: ABC transporter ATP-binding protein, partial [Solirubrobacterales bacterium]